MKIRLIKYLAAFLLLWMAISVGVSAASCYYSQVTIDHTKVGNSGCCTAEDVNNYVVRLVYTQNRFKTIGNGGHTANANGYDIRPYSDTCTTPITAYELQYFDGTTGQVVINVKRSLSHTTDDTTIKLCNGDTALVTDGSNVASTWSNNYISSFHLDSSSGSLNVNDALGAHNGTNTGVTLNTSGLIAGAADYNADTDKIQLATSYIVAGLTKFTISAAIKTSQASTANGLPIYVERDAVLSYYQGMECCVNAGGYTDRLLNHFRDSSANALEAKPSAAVNDNAWHILNYTYSYSGGTGTIYACVDDCVTGTTAYVTASGTTTNAYSGSNIVSAIGYQSTSPVGWRNLIDEVVLGGDIYTGMADHRQGVWTNYNNMIGPTTFAVLGTESALPCTANAKPLTFVVN